MKRVTLLVVAATIAILLVNCISNTYLPKPPELAGKYRGWFIWTPVSTKPDTQAILWEFDNSDSTRPTFRMSVDVDSPELNPDFCLCEVYGLYDVSDKVELRPYLGHIRIPDIGNCTTCNKDQIPSGLLNPVNIFDTLKLTQTSDTLTTQIVLVRTAASDSL